MKSSLKIWLLSSSIYPIITKIYGVLGLKKKIRGVKNVLEINSGVLFRKSFIFVKGIIIKLELVTDVVSEI